MKIAARSLALLVLGSLQFACLTGFSEPASAVLSPPTVPLLSVVSTQQGPSVFISYLSIQDSQVKNLTSISFMVQPKPNSTAQPVRATYLRSYLLAQGWINAVSKTIHVPVYGLYANYSNTVVLSATHLSVVFPTSISSTISTPALDPSLGCAMYDAKTFTQARDARVALQFSFFMLKDWSNCRLSPIVMDIDGNLRWGGTMGVQNYGYNTQSPASTFFANKFFLGEYGGTHLLSESLDGTSSTVGNYGGAPDNVTNIAHHNIDPGKVGMLLDVNTQTNTESTILEISASGTVLRTFDLASILRNYINAHCDPVNPLQITVACAAQNPLLTNWLRPTDDWFHNNAAVYWPSQNELVVSSRENFVIAIDYTTLKIKWILGDTTKAWYQDYPSLRPLALQVLGANAVAPIGQHALSITPNGQLLLFDDGLQSYNQSPAGLSRPYAAPRQYLINRSTMTASMTWAYTHNQDIVSQICSSIYRVGNSSLIDYAASPGAVRIIALGLNDQVAFDVSIPGSITEGWNALPISIENIFYS